VNAAREAPLVNHLCPSITRSSTATSGCRKPLALLGDRVEG
jgi:hypothetical protein